ncbi:MAG: TonB-dependent receptor [Bryobacteraceae bacterium]|nr:TonB-dependent receptor [Bryobacteraceae bacterium]
MRELRGLVAGLILCGCAQAATLQGVVRDASGGAVPDASVAIRSATGDLLETLRTTADGSFEYKSPRAGTVRVSASQNGFVSQSALVPPSVDQTEIVLGEPESVYTRINVTASRGSVDDSAASPHVISIRTDSDILKRPAATLGNALEEAPGIVVQQSTYGQVSPFLRGLTGYQVLNLIDGVRFNNSTFRSGPNQYLAFVEPMQASRVEALLGPTGSQYGSDALGGTIQVLTPGARFSDPGERAVHGDFVLGGATADLSGFGAARVSLTTPRVFALVGASGRKHNDLRAGQGYDSRNVFHRLFGMPLDAVSNLVGERQQDSGFRQYGLQGKVAVRLRPDQTLSIYAQRGVLDGVRGYKDLLGGLGRVLSEFEPQVLNWVHGRYEKSGLGPFDSVSATLSLNQQTDGSARQNLRFTDPVTRDFSRVNAYGYAGQATMHRGSRVLASFGGEAYDERVDSTREVFTPTTGATTRPRALYPNRSSYATLGTYGEAAYQLTTRLRLGGGVRFTGVRFHTREDRTFGIPNATQWFQDFTFHSTARWQTTEWLGFQAVVSRGFRAPNLNDLGALGLNDLGYEIPVANAPGALLSTDAGESALSKGMTASSLAAESLMNYEAGLRITTKRVYARVQFFQADLYDPIVRRTLLFASSSAPTQLAGLPVTVLPQTAQQRTQSVVAVATALDPRAVKAFVNDGQSRYYGVEAMGHVRLTSHWSFDANYSYINGRDLFPSRSIRRLPPQLGTAAVRYNPSSRRMWAELSVTAAGEQSRLSGGDRDDERIGASFRRRDIADFFAGSRVAPHLSNGVFTPTSETLAQIQARVLPGISDDNTRVPLYLSTAGWATVNLRAGMPLGENWMITAALENVADRNYRIHGSGVDSPGRSAYLSLRWQF